MCFNNFPCTHGLWICVNNRNGALISEGLTSWVVCGVKGCGCEVGRRESGCGSSFHHEQARVVDVVKGEQCTYYRESGYPAAWPIQEAS